MVLNPSILQASNKVFSVPAPAGGLNYRDPYVAMPPGDARRLTNFIPDVGGLRVRRGYKEWMINSPDDDPVKSIHAYADTGFTTVSASDPPTTIPGALFAVTDNDILDITDATDTPASVFSMGGSTRSGEAYSTMLVNSAGSFLIMCSEDDGIVEYDGTIWAVPAITNVAEGDLVYPLVWKRRLWMVERDSTSAWYLPADAIAGAATEFNFGPHFKHGGYLAYLATWTIDAGEGVDDFLVAVSSSGDVVVYQGTDPSGPSTFALVGNWFVGQIPVGRRGHCQFGGDLLILSLDGINPISYITRGGSSVLQASNKEYSSKIRAALNADLRASAGTVGWGMFLHPTERILVTTVPDHGGVEKKQFVMSTTLNAWCDFSGIPIQCFCVSYGYAFSGTSDGKVLLIFTGNQDNILFEESIGTDIAAYCQPAYGYFESPVALKIFHMIRPLIISDTVPTVIVGISTDFTTIVGSLSDVMYDEVDLGGIWDEGEWDDAEWSDILGQFFEWMNVSGVGVSGSGYVEIHSGSPTTLLSIDYMISEGSTLSSF